MPNLKVKLVFHGIYAVLSGEITRIYLDTHDVQIGLACSRRKSVTKKGFAVFRVFQELSHTPHIFSLKIDTSNITPEKKLSKNLSSALRSIHSNLNFSRYFALQLVFIMGNGKILCILNTKDFAISHCKNELGQKSRRKFNFE